MSSAARYDETITLPRAVRFPVEMLPPNGFDPSRPETWPQVAGRFEHVGGRLLFMPPCGDEQQDTVADVVITLGSWVREHREFVLGTNEAGMRLGGATRAADAAIWRRSEVGARTGGYRTVPPVLAVEVAGLDDDEAYLRDKARWYLDQGVRVVWILLPAIREVVVMTESGQSRHARGEVLPAIPELPDLAADVAILFDQLSRG